MTASSMAKTVTLTSCAPLPQMYLLALHILKPLQGCMLRARVQACVRSSHCRPRIAQWRTCPSFLAPEKGDSVQEDSDVAGTTSRWLMHSTGFKDGIRPGHSYSRLQSPIWSENMNSTSLSLAVWRVEDVLRQEAPSSAAACGALLERPV